MKPRNTRQLMAMVNCDLYRVLGRNRKAGLLTLESVTSGNVYSFRRAEVDGLFYMAEGA